MAYRAGHFEILMGVGRVDRADAGPVGHHDAVEAPFGGQWGFQELVLAGRGAVDGVVRAHHQPGAGLGDGVLECCQVELPQGAFVHHGVRGETLGFGFVGQVVLGRCTNTHGLDAGHISCGHGSCEARVLAHALEVAAAQRRAVEIDGGPQDGVDALAAGLLAQDLAVTARRFDAPGRGQSRGRR
ncbi:hypothetical protein D3C73_1085580 [compost metagenome]